MVGWSPGGGARNRLPERECAPASERTTGDVLSFRTGVDACATAFGVRPAKRIHSFTITILYFRKYISPRVRRVAFLSRSEFSCRFRRLFIYFWYFFPLRVCTDEQCSVIVASDGIPFSKRFDYHINNERGANAR